MKRLIAFLGFLIILSVVNAGEPELNPSKYLNDPNSIYYVNMNFSGVSNNFSNVDSSVFITLKNDTNYSDFLSYFMYNSKASGTPESVGAIYGDSYYKNIANQSPGVQLGFLRGDFGADDRRALLELRLALEKSGLIKDEKSALDNSGEGIALFYKKLNKEGGDAVYYFKGSEITEDVSYIDYVKYVLNPDLFTFPNSKMIELKASEMNIKSSFASDLYRKYRKKYPLAYREIPDYTIDSTSKESIEIKKILLDVDNPKATESLRKRIGNMKTIFSGLKMSILNICAELNRITDNLSTMNNNEIVLGEKRSLQDNFDSEIIEEKDGLLVYQSDLCQGTIDFEMTYHNNKEIIYYKEEIPQDIRRIAENAIKKNNGFIYDSKEMELTKNWYPLKAALEGYVKDFDEAIKPQLGVTVGSSEYNRSILDSIVSIQAKQYIDNQLTFTAELKVPFKVKGIPVEELSNMGSKKLAIKEFSFYMPDISKRFQFDRTLMILYTDMYLYNYMVNNCLTEKEKEKIILEMNSKVYTSIWEKEVEKYLREYLEHAIRLIEGSELKNIKVTMNNNNANNFNLEIEKFRRKVWESGKTSSNSAIVVPYFDRDSYNREIDKLKTDNDTLNSFERNIDFTSNCDKFVFEKYFKEDKNKFATTDSALDMQLKENNSLESNTYGWNFLKSDEVSDNGKPLYSYFDKYTIKRYERFSFRDDPTVDNERIFKNLKIPEGKEMDTIDSDVQGTFYRNSRVKVESIFKRKDTTRKIEQYKTELKLVIVDEKGNLVELGKEQISPALKDILLELNYGNNLKESMEWARFESRASNEAEISKVCFNLELPDSPEKYGIAYKKQLKIGGEYNKYPINDKSRIYYKDDNKESLIYYYFEVSTVPEKKSTTGSSVVNKPSERALYGLPSVFYKKLDLYQFYKDTITDSGITILVEGSQTGEGLAKSKIPDLSYKESFFPAFAVKHGKVLDKDGKYQTSKESIVELENPYSIKGRIKIDRETVLLYYVENYSMTESEYGLLPKFEIKTSICLTSTTGDAITTLSEYIKSGGNKEILKTLYDNIDVAIKNSLARELKEVSPEKLEFEAFNNAMEPYQNTDSNSDYIKLMNTGCIIEIKDLTNNEIENFEIKYNADSNYSKFWKNYIDSIDIAVKQAESSGNLTNFIESVRLCMESYKNIGKIVAQNPMQTVKNAHKIESYTQNGKNSQVSEAEVMKITSMPQDMDEYTTIYLANLVHGKNENRGDFSVLEEELREMLTSSAIKMEIKINSVTSENGGTQYTSRGIVTLTDKDNKSYKKKIEIKESIYPIEMPSLEDNRASYPLLLDQKLFGITQDGREIMVPIIVKESLEKMAFYLPKIRGGNLEFKKLEDVTSCLTPEKKSLVELLERKFYPNHFSAKTTKVMRYLSTSTAAIGLPIIAPKISYYFFITKDSTGIFKAEVETPKAETSSAVYIRNDKSDNAQEIVMADNDKIQPVIFKVKADGGGNINLSVPAYLSLTLMAGDRSTGIFLTGNGSNSENSENIIETLNKKNWKSGEYFYTAFELANLNRLMEKAKESFATYIAEKISNGEEIDNNVKECLKTDDQGKIEITSSGGITKAVLKPEKFRALLNVMFMCENNDYSGSASALCNIRLSGTTVSAINITGETLKDIQDGMYYQREKETGADVFPQIIITSNRASRSFGDVTVSYSKYFIDNNCVDTSVVNTQEEAEAAAKAAFRIEVPGNIDKNSPQKLRIAIISRDAVNGLYDNYPNKNINTNNYDFLNNFTNYDRYSNQDKITIFTDTKQLFEGTLGSLISNFSTVRMAANPMSTFVEIPLFVNEYSENSPIKGIIERENSYGATVHILIEPNIKYTDTISKLTLESSNTTLKYDKNDFATAMFYRTVDGIAEVFAKDAQVMKSYDVAINRDIKLSLASDSNNEDIKIVTGDTKARFEFSGFGRFDSKKGIGAMVIASLDVDEAKNPYGVKYNLDQINNPPPQVSSLTMIDQVLNLGDSDGFIGARSLSLDKLTTMSAFFFNTLGLRRDFDYRAKEIIVIRNGFTVELNPNNLRFTGNDMPNLKKAEIVKVNYNLYENSIEVGARFPKQHKETGYFYLMRVTSSAISTVERPLNSLYNRTMVVGKQAENSNDYDPITDTLYFEKKIYLYDRKYMKEKIDYELVKNVMENSLIEAFVIDDNEWNQNGEIGNGQEKENYSSAVMRFNELASAAQSSQTISADSAVLKEFSNPARENVVNDSCYTTRNLIGRMAISAENNLNLCAFSAPNDSKARFDVYERKFSTTLQSIAFTNTKGERIKIGDKLATTLKNISKQSYFSVETKTDINTPKTDYWYRAIVLKYFPDFPEEYIDKIEIDGNFEVKCEYTTSTITTGDPWNKKETIDQTKFFAGTGKNYPKNWKTSTPPDKESENISKYFTEQYKAMNAELAKVGASKVSEYMNSLSTKQKSETSTGQAITAIKISESPRIPAMVFSLDRREVFEKILSENNSTSGAIGYGTKNFTAEISLDNAFIYSQPNSESWRYENVLGSNEKIIEIAENPEGIGASEYSIVARVGDCLEIEVKEKNNGELNKLAKFIAKDICCEIIVAATGAPPVGIDDNDQDYMNIKDGIGFKYNISDDDIVKYKKAIGKLFFNNEGILKEEPSNIEVILGILKVSANKISIKGKFFKINNVEIPITANVTNDVTGQDYNIAGKGSDKNRLYTFNIVGSANNGIDLTIQGINKCVYPIDNEYAKNLLYTLNNVENQTADSKITEDSFALEDYDIYLKTLLILYNEQKAMDKLKTDIERAVSDYERISSKIEEETDPESVQKRLDALKDHIADLQAEYSQRELVWTTLRSVAVFATATVVTILSAGAAAPIIASNVFLASTAVDVTLATGQLLDTGKASISVGIPGTQVGIKAGLSLSGNFIKSIGVNAGIDFGKVKVGASADLSTETGAINFTGNITFAIGDSGRNALGFDVSEDGTLGVYYADSYANPSANQIGAAANFTTSDTKLGITYAASAGDVNAKMTLMTSVTKPWNFSDSLVKNSSISASYIPNETAPYYMPAMSANYKGSTQDFTFNTSWIKTTGLENLDMFAGLQYRANAGNGASLVDIKAGGIIKNGDSKVNMTNKDKSNPIVRFTENSTSNVFDTNIIGVGVGVTFDTTKGDNALFSIGAFMNNSKVNVWDGNTIYERTYNPYTQSWNRSDLTWERVANAVKQTSAMLTRVQKETKKREILQEAVDKSRILNQDSIKEIIDNGLAARDRDNIKASVTSTQAILNGYVGKTSEIMKDIKDKMVNAGITVQSTSQKELDYLTFKQVQDLTAEANKAYEEAAIPEEKSQKYKNTIKAFDEIASKISVNEEWSKDDKGQYIICDGQVMYKEELEAKAKGALALRDELGNNSTVTFTTAQDANGTITVSSTVGEKKATVAIIPITDNSGKVQTMDFIGVSDNDTAFVKSLSESEQGKSFNVTTNGGVKLVMKNPDERIIPIASMAQGDGFSFLYGVERKREVKEDEKQSINIANMIFGIERKELVMGYAGKVDSTILKSSKLDNDAQNAINTVASTRAMVEYYNKTPLITQTMVMDGDREVGTFVLTNNIAAHFAATFNEIVHGDLKPSDVEGLLKGLITRFQKEQASIETTIKDIETRYSEDFDEKKEVFKQKMVEFKSQIEAAIEQAGDLVTLANGKIASALSVVQVVDMNEENYKELRKEMYKEAFCEIKDSKKDNEENFNIELGEDGLIQVKSVVEKIIISTVPAATNETNSRSLVLSGEQKAQKQANILKYFKENSAIKITPELQKAIEKGDFTSVRESELLSLLENAKNGDKDTKAMMSDLIYLRISSGMKKGIKFNTAMDQTFFDCETFAKYADFIKNDPQLSEIKCYQIYDKAEMTLGQIMAQGKKYADSNSFTISAEKFLKDTSNLNKAFTKLQYGSANPITEKGISRISEGTREAMKKGGFNFNRSTGKYDGLENLKSLAEKSTNPQDKKKLYDLYDILEGQNKNPEKDPIKAAAKLTGHTEGVMDGLQVLGGKKLIQSDNNMNVLVAGAFITNPEMKFNVNQKAVDPKTGKEVVYEQKDVHGNRYISQKKEVVKEVIPSYELRYELGSNGYNYDYESKVSYGTNKSLDVPDGAWDTTDKAKLNIPEPTYSPYQFNYQFTKNDGLYTPEAKVQIGYKPSDLYIGSENNAPVIKSIEADSNSSYKFKIRFKKAN